MTIATSVLASRLMVRARLRHIEALVKIRELGSVKRAAEALGLTQPSTSHVLAELERLLECQLFIRHARGVTPTPITLALLPYARRILEAVHACAEVTSAMTTTADSVVRVAAISSAVSGLLTQMLLPFSRLHPGVWLNVLETDMREIGELIAQDGIDLALCREPDIVPQGWGFVPLLEDRYIIAAGPRHPLAAVPEVSMEALFAETWMLIPSPGTPRYAFDQLIAAAGANPEIKPIGTRSMTIITACLQAERLITVVPQSMIQHALDKQQLVRLDVVLPLACAPLGILMPSAGAGAAALAVMAYFTEHWPGVYAGACDAD
jgi:DNA-binding transcriptional LysR family regulator